MGRKRKNRKQPLKVEYFPEDKLIRRQGYKYARLTPAENKLLVCLSTGYVESIEELTRNMNISENNLRNLKKRLVDKTKLNIEAVTNSGYILRDYLYIESTKLNEIEYLKECLKGEKINYEKYSRAKKLSNKGNKKEQKRLGKCERAIVIYNPITMTISRENYKEVELTELENNLLMSLSTGEIKKYDDLMIALNVSLSRLHKLKRELVDKTKINIEYKTGIGYVLKDELKFKTINSIRFIDEYRKSIEEKMAIVNNCQEELEDEYAM